LAWTTDKCQNTQNRALKVQCLNMQMMFLKYRSKMTTTTAIEVNEISVNSET